MMLVAIEAMTRRLKEPAAREGGREGGRGVCDVEEPSRRRTRSPDRRAAGPATHSVSRKCPPPGTPPPRAWCGRGAWSAARGPAPSAEGGGGGKNARRRGGKKWPAAQPRMALRSQEKQINTMNAPERARERPSSPRGRRGCEEFARTTLHTFLPTKTVEKNPLRGFATCSELQSLQARVRALIDCSSYHKPVLVL